MSVGAGLFIAVGHKGQRAVSHDGKEWQHPVSGRDGEVYRDVCAGEGRSVAVGAFGGSNIFAATQDGVDWKTGTRDAHYSTYLLGIGFGKGSFLGLGGDPGSVGAARPFVMETQDGITWSDAEPIEGKFVLRRLAWGADRFVAVGDRGRRATSRDGKAWQDAPDVRAIDTLVDVAFGKGLFVGVGLHGLRMTSPDGLKWSAPLRGEEGEHLNRILWTGAQFVAVGLGATYFSPDGTNWERRSNRNAPLTAAFGNGVYVGAQWKGRLLYSTDGVSWEQGYKSDEHFEAVVFAAGLSGLTK